MAREAACKTLKHKNYLKFTNNSNTQLKWPIKILIWLFKSFVVNFLYKRIRKFTFDTLPLKMCVFKLISKLSSSVNSLCDYRRPHNTFLCMFLCVILSDKYMKPTLYRWIRAALTWEMILACTECKKLELKSDYERQATNNKTPRMPTRKMVGELGIRITEEQNRNRTIQINVIAVL